MKRSFLMLLAVLLATQVTFAQKQGSKHPKANPELQKEMGAYIESNVQPVLLKAQQDFDDKLSPEDLTFIKQKREQAIAHKAEMKAHRQKVKELREEGKTRDEIRDALGINPDEKKEAREEERAAMKAFIERNKETLKASKEALKPSYETWVKDQKAIVKKYKPEGKKAQNKPQNEDIRKQKGERGEKGKRGKRGQGIGLFGLMPQRPLRHGPEGRQGMERKKEMPDRESRQPRAEGENKREGHRGPKSRWEVEFVLWDGTLPEPPADNPGFKKLIERGKDVFSLQNYPNPANGITKISADLPTDTKVVKIVLRDASGKTVKNLLFKNVDKGTTTFDLDVSDLTDGLYFYTFEADGQTTTKRLVVGK